MRTESCREWRESLGAYALGHLSAGLRAGLEAHLDGCLECCAEADSLAFVARLLPHADPERFFAPTPAPPAGLAERIAARIGAERRRERRRRWRWRFGLALSGASTAAAAAVLAISLAAGGGGGAGQRPEQRVAFGSLPPGIRIVATLEPHAFGTEIRMDVWGIRSGTLCRVFLRGPHGMLMPAGTFRYRYGNDTEAVLSSALDLSRTEAVGLRAGNHTFIAPVGVASAHT